MFVLLFCCTLADLSWHSGVPLKHVWFRIISNTPCYVIGLPNAHPDDNEWSRRVIKLVSSVVKSDGDQSHLQENGLNKNGNRQSTFQNECTKWEKTRNSELVQNQKNSPNPKTLYSFQNKCQQPTISIKTFSNKLNHSRPQSIGTLYTKQFSISMQNTGFLTTSQLHTLWHFQLLNCDRESVALHIYS